MTNFDSAWKEALDVYFEPFMAFFFPDAHREIDWSRAWDMLDKELEPISSGSELGRRVPDKLVNVWRRDGRNAWVLVHIEVQSQPETDFAKRMFVYNYRLFERYNRNVASFAILGDDRPAWRPNWFGYKLGGSEMGLRFAMAKLLDYAADEAQLTSDPNPFAVLVLAHLKTLQTAGDVEARKAAEVQLVKGQIRQLYRLIDTMMDLPQPLAELALNEIYGFEQEKQMPLMSTAERIGHEAGFAEGLEKGRQVGQQEGRQEGSRQSLLRGLEVALELKFGEAGREMLSEVDQIQDIELIDNVLQGVKAAASPDELRQLWQPEN